MCLSKSCGKVLERFRYSKTRSFREFLFMFLALALWGELSVCLPLENDKSRSSGPVTLYVSLAGDDHWSGTLPQPNEAKTDGPLATVNQAAALSKKHKHDAVTVVVEPGVYYLSTPLQLDHSHSRSADAPLTFTGCASALGSPNAVQDFPVLSAGYKLTNYTQRSDGNYIVYVPDELKGTNITQLFVNGQREPLARKPNNGYLYWKSPLEPCRLSNSEQHGARMSQRQRSAVRDSPGCPDVDRYGFVFNEGDINPQWTNIDEVWLLVFAAWTASWHHIKSVDYSNSTLMFQEPAYFAVGEFYGASGRRYYVENVLEELDAPGEWYYSKFDGYIIYKPRQEAALQSMEFIVPQQISLLTMNEVKNVNFECLSFQHSLEGSDYRQAYHSTEATVVIFKSSNIRISKCDIQHSGTCCLLIGQKSSNITVILGRTADCGGDGISMDETSTNIAIEANIVNTTGFIYMMQPTGIRVQGQRNITIKQNEVLNVPYAATMIGWQAGFPWEPPTSPDYYVFNVRYNYLHHYGLGILNDFGGVYISADSACWQQTTNSKPPSCNMATRVEQNIMHDADCFNYGADGMYTDENAGGVDLVSNLVYDVNAAGISLHCGVHLTSTNNFFINADYAGNRGVISACNMAGFTKPLPITAVFRYNIVFMLEKVSHFITPYTQLGNSTFDYNIYYDTSKPFLFANNTNFRQWQASGQDKDSKITDPKFISVKNRDFHLVPDSPALGLGIAPIDFEAVGPRFNPFKSQRLPAWTPLVPLQSKRRDP